MRTETIECKSRATAKKRATWACRIVKVVGGYKCFEYESDYQAWKRQK